MQKNTATLYDSVLNDRVISTSIEDFLKTAAVEGPNVTISMVMDVLKILKDRLEIGQKITLEKSQKVLTADNFYAYLRENFSEYICERLSAA